MRYDKLLEPLSDEEPCGPDLDEEGDDDFINYTFGAEDRLPTRFFDADTGAPFDKSSVDLKSEIKQIKKLLESSRDLRLLSLDARFHCLSGNIIGFSEAIQASAQLIDKYWENIHPIGTDDNFFMRQNILETLSSRITVLLPLQFATLVNDKRSGNVTYRQHAISLGEVEPREGESTLDSGAIAAALSSDDNSEQVALIHASIGEAKKSLESIRNSFTENSGYEYAPMFDDLTEELTRYNKLLETGQQSLASDIDSDIDNDEDAADDESGSTRDTAPKKAAIPTSLSDGTKILVSDQSAAVRALAGAETYFATFEPSAPALILVHQARVLVGKPLVEALQALLPEKATSAMIKLDSDSKFEINMARMQELSQKAATSASGENAFVGPQPEEPGFNAQTRIDATALILAVEGYYRSCESSSPIPLLLSKARDYLSRDFNAIIKDLIPQAEIKE